MKKFTLLAVAALFAATASFAQAGAIKKKPEKAKFSATAAQKIEKRTSLIDRHEGMEMSFQSKQRTLAGKQMGKRIASPAVIVDQPEGTLKNKIAAFKGAYLFMGYYPVLTEVEDGVAQVVEGADGNIYIKGLFVDAYNWVKAERLSEGSDTLVIERQCVLWDDETYASYGDYVDEYYVSKFRTSAFEEDGETYIDFVAVDEPIYLLYKDGELSTLPEYSVETSIYKDYPDYAIGVDNIFGGESYGWYDLTWDLTTTAMDDVMTTLPAGAKLKKYGLTYTQLAAEPDEDGNYQDEESIGFTQAAIVGNKVYFKLYDNTPGYIVGTFNADKTKVTIKSGQYLGVDAVYNYYIYAHVGNIVPAYDEDYDEWYISTETQIVDELVLNYDAAREIFTSDDRLAIFIDAAKDRIYYAAYYQNLQLQEYVERGGIPYPPLLSYYRAYTEDYGYGYFGFQLLPIGFTTPYLEDFADYKHKSYGYNILDTDKLSYIVEIDGEPFEFTPEEYETPEPWVELPWSFTATDIEDYNGNKIIYHYFDIAESIGIQAIYRGADAVGKSAKLVIDVVNLMYGYDFSASSLPGATAIENTTGKTVASVAYTDAQGRQISAATKGFVLKTITYTDGSTKTQKFFK